VVLKFNNKPVKTMRSLPKIVAETEINKRVDVEVWRDRKTVTTKVSVGELDEEQVAKNQMKPTKEKTVNDSVVIENLGLSLSILSKQLRKRFNYKKSSKGVVIVAINREGPSAEKGLKVGDLILEVSQKKVNTPIDVKNQISVSLASNRKSILLLVEGQSGLRFVALRLSNK